MFANGSIDPGWIGGAIGAGITALGWAAVNILKQWNANKSSTRRDAIDEWQQIVKRLEDRSVKLEEQNERRDAVIKQLQNIIHEMLEEHSDCREENAELRSAVHFLYENLQRVHSLAIQNGPHDPGPLPALPAMRNRPNRKERNEFLLKQAEQATESLKEADKVIKNPPEAPKS